MPLGVSSTESANMVRNALIGAALLGVVAMPAYGQLVYGGGGGGGGGLTGGVFGIGNTVNSSSGVPLGNSLTISGGGVLSAGMSGATLLLSVPPGVSATSMSQGAVGNTTGATSSQTAPLTAQTLSGAGAVSLGYSLGTAVISAPVPVASATSAGVTALGNTTGLTSSQSQALTAQTISAAGGLSAGMSNGTLVLSGATGGAGGGSTWSQMEFFHPIISSSTITRIGQGLSSLIMEPIYIPQPVAANIVAIIGNFPTPTLQSSTSSGTASGTFTQSAAYYAVIYSQNGVGSFSSFKSAQASFSANMTLSHALTSYSITDVETFPVRSGTSSVSITGTTTQAGVNALIASPLSISFTGVRELDFQFGGTISPGNYYIGIGDVLASSLGAGISGASAISVNSYVGDNVNNQGPRFSQLNNTTGAGFIQMLSSTATIGSFGLTDLTNNPLIQAVPYGFIGNLT